MSAPTNPGSRNGEGRECARVTTTANVIIRATGYQVGRPPRSQSTWKKNCLEAQS